MQLSPEQQERSAERNILSTMVQEDQVADVGQLIVKLSWINQRMKG